MWHAVYRSDNGRLVSIGSVVADPLPAGHASRSYADRPDQRSGFVWDEATRDFVDRSATLPVLVPRLDFWRRFTETERQAIAAARQDAVNAARRDRLNAFADYVQVSDAVDLRDDYVRRAVQAMEAAGLIGAGRAAVILA